MSAPKKEKRKPHQPLGYLGARKARNQKKKFGIVKFYPKPKTQEEWHEVYLRHEINLPNVSKILLSWSNKGPGYTGIRYFSYFTVPPIRYFNKDVEINIEKSTTKQSPATIKVEFSNGKSIQKDVKNLKNEQIRAWLVENA